MGTHNGEHHVGAVTGGDDGDALGQPLQHVFGRHACHQHIHRLARQQRRIATQHSAFDRGLQLGHRRGNQQRLLGQHICFRLETLQRVGDRAHL